MADLHAWDCRCGRRSPYTADYCQDCGSHQNSGRPARGKASGDSAPIPWGWLFWLGMPVCFFALYLASPDSAFGVFLTIIAAAALVPWPVWVVLVIVGLLVRIAVAVERLGR